MWKSAVYLVTSGSMLALLAVAARAADLSGEWQAPFTVGTGTTTMKTEDVTISQSGNAFVATKRTGDDWVPAGKENLRGIVSGARFPAEQICAARGFTDPIWEGVRVTILDKDHFRVDGGCSGGAVWTRDRRPKTS